MEALVLMMEKSEQRRMESEQRQMEFFNRQQSNMQQTQPVQEYFQPQNGLWTPPGNTLMHDVQVNKINARPDANRSMPYRPVQSRSTPGNQAKQMWETNQMGKPIRCNGCGLMGHRERNCLRTCTATCHKCGKIGHLQTVCRNSAKN